MNAKLMEYFNNKFAQMDQKFDRIERKLEQMDKRFEHCEERIGQSDSKIQKLTDDLENRMEDLRLDVAQDLKIKGQAIHNHILRDVERKFEAEFAKRTPSPVISGQSNLQSGTVRAYQEDEYSNDGGKEPNIDNPPHVVNQTPLRPAENFRAYEGPPNRGVRPAEDELKGIKFTVPSFKGSHDPNEFIEWRDQMSLIFDCHHYAEIKKVQLAVSEFKDYALTWWQKAVRDVQYRGYPPINTWGALLRIMDARFVPPDYRRNLYQKLQFLTQGSKTVEDYFKEMEVLMMRSQIE